MKMKMRMTGNKVFFRYYLEKGGGPMYKIGHSCDIVIEGEKAKYKEMGKELCHYYIPGEMMPI